MCKKFSVTISRMKSLQGNMSVAAFARYIGIPQKTLDSCIKGERKPSVEIVMHICARCDCSADWLLGLSDVRDVAQTAAPSQLKKIIGRPPPRSDTDLLAEIRALRSRVDALESRPAFACG